jgi:hypothetical protein
MIAWCPECGRTKSEGAIDLYAVIGARHFTPDLKQACPGRLQRVAYGLLPPEASECVDLVGGAAGGVR